MGELIMTHCEQMGINPKWPKLKGVMERHVKYNNLEDDATYNEELSSKVSPYINRLDDNENNSIPAYLYEPWSRYQCEMYLIHALQRRNWLAPLARYCAFNRFAIEQRFFWHHQYRIIWPNHSNGGLQSYSFLYAANMMAITSLLGWKDAVTQQGYMTIAALNRGYQLVLEYENEHRRAQAFMVIPPFLALTKSRVKRP